MDKKIVRKSKKKTIVLSALVLLCGGTALALIASPGAPGTSVPKSSIVLGTVVEGEFSETLALRGVVQPKETVFLDAVEGGRVEQRFVESGTFVKQGQPLIQLSNTVLQLDLISREAQVSEQINFLRNTQMQMETNHLDLQRSLLDNEHQINTLSRHLTQAELLVERGLLAREQLKQLQQDKKYQQGKLQLTKKRLAQEESIRTEQLKQLTDSVNLLKNNLELARKNASSLLIKAPVSGYLSALNSEQGEFKTAGARLGQIDIADAFRLDVMLDEFYLSRVQPGMQARLDGVAEPVTLSRIDSQVVNNMFKVEFALPTTLPELRRGQTLNLSLQLSDGQLQSKLLPKGQFLNDSGGHFVYVSRGDTAMRQPVKLGKQNHQFIQVLDGLSVGDQVVISGYQHFNQAAAVQFQQ
jgi:HlyD family secretion protein